MDFKNYFFILFCFICYKATGQSFQNINWIVKDFSVIIQSDTAHYYSINSSLNPLDLSKVTYTFLTDNNYQIKHNNQLTYSGRWSKIDEKYLIDEDSTIMKFSSTTLTMKNLSVVYTDSLDAIISETIITFINPNCTSVETIKSGDWSDESVWSCGKIPLESDDVIIHSGHRIILSKQMGVQKCKKLLVEYGAFFDNQGNFFLANPDQ